MCRCESVIYQHNLLTGPSSKVPAYHGAISVQSIVKPFTAAAAASNGLIVYPEGSDARIVEAAVKLQNLGLSRAVLLGKPDAISAVFDSLKLSSDGIGILDPDTSPELARPAARNCCRKSRPWVLKKPPQWCAIRSISEAPWSPVVKLMR